MKIILDTANIVEIKKCVNIVDVNHITTNPILLNEAGITDEKKFIVFSKRLEEIIPGVNLFFQCFKHSDIESLVSIKEKYGINVNYIAKVTMLPEYFPLIKEAQSLELETAATTCYDIIQINHACEMGMNYSMVYFAKNEDQSLLKAAVDLKKNYNYLTDLIAASFRTKADVIAAINSGIDYATISPDVLRLAYNNTFAKKDIEEMK